MENNFMQRFVVNTLFQEVTDYRNQKDETQKLDPCWKFELIVWQNSELKLESGLWVKITLNFGSEFLMD